MKKGLTTKIMVQLAMLIALSAVGAYLALPSPIGTVALDSAPGYLAALLFGGLNGGIVLCLGHLVSAFKVGFPLGMLHILIAILMGGCGLAYYFITKKVNLIFSSIITIILNGIVMNALLIPFLGIEFFISMLSPLLLGSAVNIVLAGVIYKLIKNKVRI